MNKIANVLIALGVVCLMSAVGNDDYYSAMEMFYPLKYLILWIISGFAFIGAGSLIKLKG